MKHEQQRNKAAAWAVHAFTASGIVLGFMAVIATINGDRIAAFLWLGLALFVDGMDGTMARRFKVTEILPQIDGSNLDLVTDYFTYVLVPALMIYMFGVVPEGWEIITAIFIMLVSLYTFVYVGAKTSDYYFSGFPALWNVMILYFHVLDTSTSLNLAIIILAGIFTFAPIKFVHPLRVRALRHITIPVTVVWAATSLRLVLLPPDVIVKEASPLIFWLWIASSSYFAGISLWRTLIHIQLGKGK